MSPAATARNSVSASAQPILRPGPQPDIAGLGSEVLALMSDWPGILVEPKRAGLAVHYRKAPHLGHRCGRSWR